jgi:hypothetical protein
MKMKGVPLSSVNIILKEMTFISKVVSFPIPAHIMQPYTPGGTTPGTLRIIISLSILLTAI